MSPWGAFRRQILRRDRYPGSGEIPDRESILMSPGGRFDAKFCDVVDIEAVEAYLKERA